jgi:tripartite-type tricarboxylate transporter receptor subunit TctC
MSLRAAAVALALTLPVGGNALAQRYPQKPLQLIVPFPAGGGSDILARAVAPKLGEQLGQPIVVENRGGAGGNIGSDAVAKAGADGHTILFGSNTLAINAGLYPKLSFDPVKDFAPVGMVAAATMVLVVNPGVPVKTVKELIDLAKASPDKVNFSTPGNGTPQHIAAELFNRMAGVRITHVIYRGTGPALTDLLSGQTQASVMTLAAAKPHIDSGKLKALGVASAKRSAVMPALPTIAEAGVPGYEAELWYALFVPAATDRAIVTRLNAELRKALTTPDVREKLAQQGFETIEGPPEKLAEVLKADLAKYGTLIREANIKAE